MAGGYRWSHSKDQLLASATLEASKLDAGSAAGDDANEFDLVALAQGARIPFFAVQGQAVVLD